MTPNDLHLIIHKRPTKLWSSNYPLTIEMVGHELGHSILRLPLLETEAALHSGAQLGLALLDALSPWKKLIDVKYTEFLLLEIKSPDLYPLPWEKMFENARSTNWLKGCTVVRYDSRPSGRVAQPFSLPLSVLVASDSSKEVLVELPTEKSLRYFQTTKVNGITNNQLRTLLRGLKFDVVHLCGHAKHSTEHGTTFFVDQNDPRLNDDELRLLLKKCQARLLILHAVGENESAFMTLSHRLMSANGPTIIVTRNLGLPVKWEYDQLYLDIVHDTPLNYSFRNIPVSTCVAFFVCEQGQDVLRISPLAQTLHADLSSRIEYLTSITEKLSPGKSPFKLPTDVKLLDIASTLESIKRSGVVQRSFSFTQESAGLEPLKEISQTIRDLQKKIDENESLVKRVVNSWFRKDEQFVKPSQNLEPNTEYKFEIQIGLPSKWSIVQHPPSIPEKEFAKLYTSKGVELNVQIFSNDFFVENSVGTLILYPPPAESKTLSFPVRTSTLTKTARLRVCIYYEQNLIQSLLVRAGVGEVDSNDNGNRAEIDFTLNNDLTEIERMEKRSLSIALNEDENGTHSFFISGSQVRAQFDFGDGQIRTAINTARQALQHVCGAPGQGGYLFDSKTSKGTEAKIISDLQLLAEVGAGLYSGIVTSQDINFQDLLDKTLGQAGAIIQVASTQSVNFVFPWALVYDKPYLSDSNVICDRFLNDTKAGKPSSCVQQGCPHQADIDVICPSGFWGYKHIVEQPLSLDPKKGGNRITTEIEASGIAAIMMAVSQELTKVTDHYNEMSQMKNVKIELMDNRNAIGRGLSRHDFQLIYFYCHGGRSGNDTWLGVGKGEKLKVSNLVSAWRIRWPHKHPFVFINGCHTMDATPDDFIHFNQSLAFAQAAGIMGTEITIPESLARHFASGFFQNFLGGAHVGKAVQIQRATMLSNYNVLGLAYTPYCSSDLKITYTN